MFDICTDLHFDSPMSVQLPIGHPFVMGDLTKPDITITSVDRFYLNLVICLQLDIALLVQNSVKILTMFAGDMTMYTGGYFFRDAV